MIYNNELMKIAMAVSQGSLSEEYDLSYGADWIVEFNKAQSPPDSLRKAD